MFSISHPGFKGVLRGGGLGVLARLLSVSRIDRFLISNLNRSHKDGYIRAVNYHDIQEQSASNFRRHLAFYAKYFSPVTLADLNKYYETGKWHKEKPGLIISFDDGIKSNFDVAKPLLEEYGFCGWFFVPTNFIDCPALEQIEFAKNNRINVYSTPMENGVVAMSWDELRELDKGHVVGSHTKSHQRFEAGLGAVCYQEETEGAAKVLANQLGHSVSTFCWVGGEKTSYSAAGAKAIKNADYDYAFMTVSDVITNRTDPHCLQRTNIEAEWPLWAVRFQLSGILDRLYKSKRLAVLQEVQGTHAD